MLLAIYHVFVNLGMKVSRTWPAEPDTSIVRPFLETKLTCSPCELSHCETVSISCCAGPKFAAQFLGCKPLVIGGGLRILPFVDRAFQRLFLLRAPPQLQEHVRHRETVLYCSLIEFRDSKRVGVAASSTKFASSIASTI